MCNSIYDQHDKYFRDVCAYAVIHDGEPVARISVRFPRDGAGRLYAYAHWLGRQMVRGSASGGGYDKTGAALHDAARRREQVANEGGRETAFWQAIGTDSGFHFQRRLEDAGFRVLQTL